MESPTKNHGPHHDLLIILFVSFTLIFSISLSSLVVPPVFQSDSLLSFAERERERENKKRPFTHFLFLPN